MSRLLNICHNVQTALQLILIYISGFLVGYQGGRAFVAERWMALMHEGKAYTSHFGGNGRPLKRPAEHPEIRAFRGLKISFSILTGQVCNC